MLSALIAEAGQLPRYSSSALRLSLCLSLPLCLYLLGKLKTTALEGAFFAERSDSVYQ